MGNSHVLLGGGDNEKTGLGLAEGVFREVGLEKG
jgi:hypothetical protein